MINTRWQSSAACRASHPAERQIGNVWYHTELFSLVITTRMIIALRWCLNSATRNCFYEHIIQANYLLCSLLLLDTNSKSRAGIALNNWISFLGQKQKKGFACLCLSAAPTARPVLSVCEAEKVMVGYKSSQVRDLSHRKIWARFAWPCRVLPPPELRCANKGTFCSSQLRSQRTKYAHRQRRRAVPPSARNQAFLPSLWAHRAFILPFWAAAFRCSELWLVLEARAELQCTNHLLGLEQHSGPACLQLSAEILFEAPSFGVFAVPLTGED